MSLQSESLAFHKKAKGKLAIQVKVPLKTRKDLSLAYTPGVAGPCLAIAKDKRLAYAYTSKWNTIAVVTDGTRVLGLGDIGPEAALPVMEGKCALFKEFGNVDAIPICIDTKDADEFVRTVKLISPSLGGINLEDIETPKCFEIEKKLKEQLDIPVFHDDQHGTAVVTLAGLINALKVVGKEKGKVRVVINGAGAAGTAIAKLLLHAGFAHLIVCDRQGALVAGDTSLASHKLELANITKNYKRGSLEEVAKGADVLIGVSAPDVFTPQIVRNMNKKAIVFALANPTPEIDPELAKKAGAAVVATGRSDYENQANNVLAFPGIMRGALDARASEINEEMKLAAAHVLASAVAKPTSSKILPDPLERGIHKKVGKAVEKAAQDSGVARV